MGVQSRTGGAGGMGAPPPAGRGRMGPTLTSRNPKSLLLAASMLFQNPPRMAFNASERGIGRIIFSKGCVDMDGVGFLLFRAKI